MATTSNKLYSVQSAGANSGVWGAGNPGVDLNTGVIGIIDSNMAGVYSASLASTNVGLAQTDVQNCMYRFTGALLANIIVSPNGGVTMAGFFMFENYTTGNFSVTLTTGAGSVVLPQSRAGILFIDGTNGPRILAIVGQTNADPIPVGTVMLFLQAAAPTGWTQVTSLNGYGLQIVSGTGAGTSGSVAYGTLFSRTSVDSYAITISDLPPHAHSFTYTTNGTPGGITTSVTSINSTGGNVSTATQNTGNGTAHTHGLNMQLQTANVIQCSKN